MLHTILFDYNNTLAWFPGNARITHIIYEANKPFYAEIAAQHHTDLDSIVQKLDPAISKGLRDARVNQTLCQEQIEQIISDVLANNHLVGPAGWAYNFARSRYETLCRMAQPASDAVPVLKKLQEQGYTLGLVTNGFFPPDMIRKNLDYAGMLPYFDTCIFASEVGYAKPDTRIFEYALRGLTAESSETAVVGDERLNDIAPARSLGCWTVQTLQFKQDLLDTVHPHCSIHALIDLPAVLAAENGL
jgi:HAD superfamily hydrolase (TIGR01549 family)